MKIHISKSLIIVFLSSIISFSAFAVTYTSISSGNWNSPSTWLNGVVPPYSLNAGDRLTINIGHEVIMTENLSFGSVSGGSSCTIMINGSLEDIGGDFTITLGPKANVNIGASGILSVYDLIYSSSKASLSIAGGGILNYETLTNSVNGTLINNGTINPLYYSEGSSLSVVLLSQEISIVEGTVIIKWSTASEINNNYFSIEKSVDANIFKSIATIMGNGSTNGLSEYKFVDSEVVLGNTFYRITQVDYDGKSESFPILTLTNKGEHSVTIYPNPAIDIINIEAMENAHIEVYNSTGQKVQELEVQSGHNIMDISSLGHGFYMIRIIFSNQIISQKIIVR